MANKIIWGIFIILTLFLTGYILFFVKLEPAGDIVEYYGITESFLNHESFKLSSQDQQNLSLALHPEYFQDPQYYIKGKDGNRYPVHFFFYSILALPIRIILIFLQRDELKTLAITNLVILTVTSFWIMRKFLTVPFQRIVFLTVLYLSFVISFIIWPGPDLFYVCMLLLSVFYFYKKRYLPTVIFTAIASWHSQPLIIIALAALGNYFLSETLKKINNERYFQISWKIFITSALLFFLILIPYFYNLAVFGLLTPWTIIENGWTKLNGFGLQNASFKKLYEQFFDLNIGFFWYAPIIFLTGCFFFFKSLISDKREWLVFLTLIVTAFFYQTNPAWHYGTAGYGPTRHILFILPFLIYFIVKYLKTSKAGLLAFSIIIISQIYTLSLNGFITPKFENTLYNSPYASFVLNNFPQLYSPTPEIFVDRTNHTDLDYITSAIYVSDGFCKKAYILKSDIEYLKKKCGSIPPESEKQLENKSMTEGVYVNY
jgi:hypothetical protein